MSPPSFRQHHKGSLKACHAGNSLFLSHGNERGCKAAEADQVSSSIQPEGRHEEGERRGDEEVGGHQDPRNVH